MSSVRKKRNFKGLHLADTPLSTPTPKAGTSSSSSTTASYNKLTGTSSTDTNGPSTAKSSSLVASSLPATDPTSGANYHNKLSEQLANLELGVEYKLDLKNEDLTFLSELGSGNGGSVTKVRIKSLECWFARLVSLALSRYYFAGAAPKEQYNYGQKGCLHRCQANNSKADIERATNIA
jgi:hypothetical protein